jgi:two-component system, cell cycle sensor histidine kinase and response regulator CckA
MVDSVTHTVDMLSGSETILVLEDEAPVLRVICAILATHGYEVLQAQNLAGALAICERRPGTIHLLLADMQLANTNGPRIAAQLVSSQPEMKVLYMSGLAASSMLLSAVHASGSRFLQKPIRPQMLIRHVRDVLGPAHKSVA